jgi:hypothetical protein
MGIVLVSLFLVFETLSCVTPKAQIEGDTQATPANTQTVKSDVPATPPDSQTTQDKDWLSYWPVVVELRGKLVTKMFYGPPNFGEDPKTDSKEVFFILVLSRPVNVRGNPDPNAGPDRVSVEHVREMELVLTIPHKNMIGKKVILKGTLFHGFTGHHHTEVLMDVQSISLAAPD